MKKIIFFFLFFVCAFLCKGQSKDCNTYYKYVEVECILIAYKHINDTFLSVAPKGCNYFLFDSTANGQWKIYSADTTTLLEIVSIKNGQRNGTNIAYYKNGQIESKSIFKDGNLNGGYISFDETGKTLLFGSFITELENGHLKDFYFIGTATLYWDNGNVARIITHKDKNSYNENTKYWGKDGNEIDYQKFNKLWYDCK